MGKRAEIGLKRKIDADQWDCIKGRGKDRSEEIRNLIPIRSRSEPNFYSATANLSKRTK
ncbi:hypothetical protein V5097_21800 [Arenibacter palladensis]